MASRPPTTIDLLAPPLPTPAPGSRAVLAAVAVGAAIAAGESVVADLGPTVQAPQLTAALVPVAAIVYPPDLDSAAAGVGREQPLPGAVAALLDPATTVEVSALTKAVLIGEELARISDLVDTALAAGAAAAAVVDDQVFVQPVVGRITSETGPRWGRQHEGLDVANSIGTPIYAVTDAVVERSGPASGFGLWVVLRHPDGSRSVYGHINRTFVEVGQRVAAGDRIAEVGNRGFSTGPHLHLEIWDTDGSKFDPTAWLRERDIAV